MSKKKVIYKLLFIVLTYMVLLLGNNIGYFIKGDNSFNFINISLLLSIFIIAITTIFSNYLFKNKINFWMVFCSIIIYNLAEGYYLNFYAYPFIIMYLFILLITCCMIIKSNKCFEISIVTGFSILLLSAFVFGLFGILKIFKYFMILFTILMIIYIYMVYKKDKNKIRKSIDTLFDSGFTIFNIMWMISILGGAGMYVHVYDEYSHWAYDAMATIYYSKIGTSQEIMLRTRGYPPIFTMWHYIISIFRGFSEHNLYVGLSMLCNIYLLPAFYYLKKNNIIIKIFAFITFVFMCYLFGNVYNYTNLYADLSITIIFSCCLEMYYILKDEKLDLKNNIVLLLIILTLSKTNGFVISLIFILIIFVNEQIEINNYNLKKFFHGVCIFIKKNISYILAIICTVLFWKVYLFIINKIHVDYYNYSLLPNSLKSDLKYKLNYDFIFNFCKQLYKSFSQELFSGMLSLNMYQYILFLLSILYIIFCKMYGKIKIALKKIIPFIISYLSFYIITVISMFVAMTYYEASVLASFGRYLNWYHLGVLIFGIFLLLKLDNKLHIMKFCILLFFVINIGFSNITYFIYNPVRNESYNLSVQRLNKVKKVIKNTEKNAFIYVIDQKDTDGIMAMWYTRYYFFPRKNNASSGVIGWKIKTNNNKDDLSDWGMTAKELSKHLLKYKFDYVFLYSKDEEFFEETSFMYDNLTIAKQNTLFKIEKVNNNIKLVPIY